MKQTLYINLYRSGFYHRAGKPNTTNLHGGDVYTSEVLAMENAEPDRGYITTVPFVADFPGTVLANPESSTPLPLIVTRSGLGVPYLVPELPTGPSLEVGDGHYGVSYEEWRDNRRESGFEPAPAAAYKPPHGGYPTHQRVPQP